MRHFSFRRVGARPPHLDVGEDGVALGDRQEDKILSLKSNPDYNNFPVLPRSLGKTFSHPLFSS